MAKAQGRQANARKGTTNNVCYGMTYLMGLSAMQQLVALLLLIAETGQEKEEWAEIRSSFV